MKNLIRPCFLDFKPYISARNTNKSDGQILLDANENPYAPHAGIGLNRYPEPQPAQLRQRLADIYDVKVDQLLLTRGMDEGIELLIRLLCTPSQDSIAIAPPTYGYYAVAAALQDVAVTHSLTTSAKIYFLCNPNNPTGEVTDLADIKTLCDRVKGQAIVAVDEAYIEFSDIPSAISLLGICDNLVVMRTLSKAHGLANLRIGTLIAAPELIGWLSSIIAPYPIPGPCAQLALQSLSSVGLAQMQSRCDEIKMERNRLMQALERLPGLIKLYPSQANFILLQHETPDLIFHRLKTKGLLIRDRQTDLAGGLRISIGTKIEIDLLLAALDLAPLPLKPQRIAAKSRKTNETDIAIELNLDGTGRAMIDTGIGFFDHMLTQIAAHSGIDLCIRAQGDLHIDAHHTIEDVAIVLGQTLTQALEYKRGITRYGFCLLPMDEILAQTALDLSGRASCCFTATFNTPMVGEFPTEMTVHFFETLAQNLQANLHIILTGDNAHHLIEGAFKSFARSLGQAIALTHGSIPSTKGTLT